MDIYFRTLTKWLGYAGAVRLEDVSVWLTGVLLGLVLGFLIMGGIVKDVRSAKLDGVLATKVLIPEARPRYFVDVDDYPNVIAAMLAVMALKRGGKHNIRRKDLQRDFIVAAIVLIICLICIAWGAYMVYHVIPKDELIEILQQTEVKKIPETPTPLPEKHP